jgi:hypothetical protein
LKRKFAPYDAAIAAALAAVSALFYRKVTRLWWMYDDAYLLRLLRDVSLPGTLHNAAFREQGRPLFNPLLLLSLKLDLLRFGDNARSFYVHQIAAFALLSALLYLMFRLWSSPLASAAAVAAFTIAGPTLVVVPELMLRHYVEGAVFATSSVILYVLAVRRVSWLLALSSALLYLCAAAAKEVYAPLILILIVIPEGSLRARTRLAIPHAIAAIVYAIWRTWTIGTSVGSFGLLPAEGTRTVAILTIPLRVARELAGSGSIAGWIVFIAVVVCVAAVVLKLRGARLVALAGAIAVIAPLIPVAGDTQPRWAFAAWLLAVVAIAMLPLAFSRVGNVAAVAVLLCAIAASRVEWPAAYRLFARMSDEARVLAHLSRDDVLLDPAMPPNAADEVKRMTGSQAKAYNDVLALCDGQSTARRIFAYDASTRTVKQVPAVSCTSIRKMPLTVRLHYTSTDTLYWDFGPYHDGTYAFILADGIAYDIPRDGGFRGPGFERFMFRIRYTSPAGWKTYSPPLTADASKGPVVFRQ